MSKISNVDRCAGALEIIIVLRVWLYPGEAGAAGGFEVEVLVAGQVASGCCADNSL